MQRLATVRRLLLAAAVLPVLFLASCERISSNGYSGDVQELLLRGESFVESITSRPGSRLSDEEVVALGYAERARLGLGSPFRLIEYALRDTTLTPETQTLLAYGVLAKTLAQKTYAVDPRVLDIARLRGVPGGRPTGSAQLDLIERAVESAPSAGAGERIVRLGYILAGAERTVDPQANAVIAYVAAMVGDRRRASDDASQLLRAAARTQQDPLVLLRDWRREGRFRVEQPPFAALTVRDEEAEAREGPALALALRSLAQRMSAPISLIDGSGNGEVGHLTPRLDRDAAERLMALAETRNYPAQAPIAVAIEINRDGLLRQRLSPEVRAARERFTREVWNEERLIAGVALLHAAGADRGQRVPLVLLQAATFLRPWNQEDPWMPGDPGPSVRDLEARHGIARVDFDPDIDDSWRPYYLRMLGRSLADLQRVLPTYSVRGMSVVIGRLPGDARALALHEPRTRTLYLPPGTGAGTLAHELAHDLDWQLARRRYGARGGYATDMAVRNNRGDRIAVAMMELSGSLVHPFTEEEPSAHSTRPAEVFARGTDWLVATSLAREGRLGGYLTSFQDPVLTGYGTTRGPDISGAAVPALFAILDGIAPVAEPAREWAMVTHGPSRSLTAAELAQALTEVGAGLPAEVRLQQIRDVGIRSFEVVSSCRYGSTAAVGRLVTAQRTLAEVSVGAVARGAAIDAVHELAAQLGGRPVREEADAWLAWRLYGAPEPVTDLIDPLIPSFEELLLRAELPSVAATVPAAPNAFRAPDTPQLCGGNPFAASSPLAQLTANPSGIASF